MNRLTATSSSQLMPCGYHSTPSPGQSSGCLPFGKEGSVLCESIACHSCMQASLQCKNTCVRSTCLIFTMQEKTLNFIYDHINTCILEEEKLPYQDLEKIVILCLLIVRVRYA